MFSGKNLGCRVREFRKLHRISQTELAAEVGCSSKTVGNIECGRVMPDLKQLVALSRITNMSLDELVFGAEYEREPKSLPSAPLEESLSVKERKIVEAVLMLIRQNG